MTRERLGKIVNCETCKKEFYITPTRIRNNKHHTCSKKCRGILSNKLYSKKVKVLCTICKKELLYKPSHIKKIKNPTCGKVCTSKMKSILYNEIGNPNSLRLTKYEKYFWSRVKTCSLRAKNIGLDCNIDYKYLKKLFEYQDGRCFYSGLKLKIEGEKTFNTASVDRIDSNNGYIKGNIVWCANAINIMKSNYKMTDVIKLAWGLSTNFPLLAPTTNVNFIEVDELDYCSTGA